MNASSAIVSMWIENSNFMAILLDAALKSTVVLACASGLCFCWRRSSAAMRHWVWFLAVAGLLCLPLSFLQSPWKKPLWGVTAELTPGNQCTVALEFTPGKNSAILARETQAVTGTEPQENAAPNSSRAQRLATHFDRQWLMAVVAIWLAGVVLLLSHLAVGRLRLRSIRLGARTPRSFDWMPLLDELRQELNLRRPVLLLESPAHLMPMTWGSWRPVVLLPVEAREWSATRQRVVLLHELAHVKRWDCLTQMITRIVRSFYWFNPLVWLAARKMRMEQERACDDLVLNSGCQASAYASHLVEIAQVFRREPQAAIAMARSSGLEGRVRAILDRSRNRKMVSRFAAALVALVLIGVSLFMGACTTTTKKPAPQLWSIERSEVGDQLKRFVAEKEAQARGAAALEGKEVLPEYKAMFTAAAKGDWLSISNVWEDLRRRAPQYEGSGPKDDRLHGTGWQTMLEIWGGFGNIAVGEERYVVRLAKDAIESIAPGSIYFGGTDPGRCVITALQKSHVNADPFFTLTQNAMADGSYLEYLRRMYGNKIYIPTKEDSDKSFQRYTQDAERRLKKKDLKPGENVKVVEGKVQVSGQVAVMSINALLAKIIFDRNPDREFYLEESFPLDWMYPHLSPTGPIMKINRQPLSELSDAVVQKDREYWSQFLEPMIGDWLKFETPVHQITAFATRNYARQPEPDQYVRGDAAQKWASKLRSSIAGVYVWRAEQTARESEKARMRQEADFAFRQAFALCPYSPEVVFRYANLLVSQNRHPEALLLAETAVKLQPTDQYRNLISELRKLQKTK